MLHDLGHESRVKGHQRDTVVALCSNKPGTSNLQLSSREAGLVLASYSPRLAQGVGRRLQLRVRSRHGEYRNASKAQKEPGATRGCVGHGSNNNTVAVCVVPLRGVAKLPHNIRDEVNTTQVCCFRASSHHGSNSMNPFHNDREKC